MRKVVKLAEAVGRMPDGVVLMIGSWVHGCQYAASPDRQAGPSGQKRDLTVIAKDFPAAGCSSVSIPDSTDTAVFSSAGTRRAVQQKAHHYYEAMLQIVCAITV